MNPARASEGAPTTARTTSEEARHTAASNPEYCRCAKSDEGVGFSARARAQPQLNSLNQTVLRELQACLAASRAPEWRPCARRGPHTSWRPSGSPT